MLVIGIASGYAQPAAPLSCPEFQPLDRYRAAAYMGDVFDAPRWTPEIFRIEQSRYFVQWYPRFADASVSLEYYPFRCGYGDREVEQFFTQASYDALFQYYESWERTGQCSTDALVLHEFELMFEGRPYQSRYWIHRYTGNRVVTVNLTFGQAERADLNAYSAALFPQLSSCAYTFRDERPPLAP